MTEFKVYIDSLSLACMVSNHSIGYHTIIECYEMPKNNQKYYYNLFLVRVRESIAKQVQPYLRYVVCFTQAVQTLEILKLKVDL